MRHLLHTNRGWLRQALELFAQTSDVHYSASPEGLVPHCAGAHLRHLLEFYECFLAGWPHGYVDYDARPRDPEVESHRAAALHKIQQILARLAEVEKLEDDRPLWVKVEASDAPGVPGYWVASSVGRELQMLASHTVHHFALIAIALRCWGVNVPSGFGVAPSTLRHHAEREAAA